MRFLPFVIALACCASRPIDCGYRPHVRVASDAEARSIDLSRIETVKIADLNDYDTTPPLPDTARAFDIEDHVMSVHGVIEKISKGADGTMILKLRDADFRVLAYVPSKPCSAGSAFAPQIEAVRRTIEKGALHVGDSVVVRALVLFDQVTPGGAASGVALTPLLGVSAQPSRTSSQP